MSDINVNEQDFNFLEWLSTQPDDVKEYFQSLNNDTSDPDPNSISQEDMDYLYEFLPGYEIYLEHPEIGPIIEEAAENEWSEQKLIAKLQQTQWWKDHTASQRQWYELQIADPAEAERLLDDARDTLRREAAALGVRLNTGVLENLALDAVRFDWDEDYRNAAIMAAIDKGEAQTTGYGIYGEGKSGIRAIAGAYIIPISDGKVDQFATRIAQGMMTLEDVELWAKTVAKARYSWMSDAIDSGITPEDYFEPIKATVANTLEINPNSIDLLDEKWAQLAEYRDENGEIRSMTAYEAAQWARDQDEYKYTDRAERKAGEYASALLQTFRGWA